MEQDIYAKKLASRNISIKCFEDKKNTNEKIIELNINTKSYLFRALVSSSKWHCRILGPYKGDVCKSSDSAVHLPQKYVFYLKSSDSWAYRIKMSLEDYLKEKGYI